MKFVHAADVHLDSPLRGLDRYEGAPTERLRGATRRAFENLIRLCLDEEVAFLLLAGDLFDGDWPDYNTGLFFVSQIARLSLAKIPTFIVRGNHDAKSRLTRSLKLPAEVFDFSHLQPETVRLDRLGVAIHGRGYPKADITENLAASYPRATRDLFNIGLLHTCADGREGHAAYAPCSLDDMASKGYDYWALGHIHAREVVSESPWIVFPGNLQGRHARETGAKGATLVTVDQGKIESVTHRPLDVVRWARCRVDVSAAVHMDDALNAVRAELGKALDAGDGRVVAARVTVTGASPAHGEIVRKMEAFRQEVRAAAVDLGGGELWVEKVEIKSEPFGGRAAAFSTADDALGGLVQRLREAQESPALWTELKALFLDLQRKLPPDFHELEGAFDLDDPTAMRAALDDVERMLISELEAGGQP